MKKVFLISIAVATLLTSCGKGDGDTDGDTDNDSRELYTITAISDGHGKAQASADKAAEGTAVTLTATPDNNNEFYTWIVETGPAELLQGGMSTANPAIFAMPAGNVTVKATFLSPNDDTGGGVLINGVRWAESNVSEPGTFAVNPEDAGMFYQWGSKVGWSVTEPRTSSPAGEVWSQSPVTGINWPPIYVPCPDGWRLPGGKQFEKLIDDNNVTSQMMEQNGITGRRFTDIHTGNHIFLPAAGYLDNVQYLGNRGYGYYWSNDGGDLPDRSCYLSFYDKGASIVSPSYYNSGLDRREGVPIRCVK
jgi:uncharacterized protein (TIGR02145 family)